MDSIISKRFKAFQKTKRVVRSCTTTSHLFSADNMIENFYKVYCNVSGTMTYYIELNAIWRNQLVNVVNLQP